MKTGDKIALVTFWAIACLLFHFGLMTTAMWLTGACAYWYLETWRTK